jgi:Haem-dependent oxidative N-demethylase, alpha subunit-like
MGLRPMQHQGWIETDDALAEYLQHKRSMREVHGDRVYRAEVSSLPAQAELQRRLRAHLLADAGDVYSSDGDALTCTLADCSAAGQGELLWDTSLWLADDLVLMEERGGDYCLTAASLCSPSHWRLDEKFGRPMREIHDPIPGFHEKLTPSIDRFFSHLRASHPVFRFNWSLQSWYGLAQFPDIEPSVDEQTPLYYRSERQSLMRLPDTGAIAFTIRVYLHPLASLMETSGALRAMFTAIDATPEPLACYKGFDTLAPALEKYRALAG